MRHWISGLIALLVLSGPLAVGYATAPCAALTGRPVPLSPYRLQQQRFLDQSAAALAAMARLAPELHRVADAAAPASMAAAFQRAGQVLTLDATLKAAVVTTLSAMREMILTERMPPPPPQRGRCEICEFHRFCNDVV